MMSYNACITWHFTNLALVDTHQCDTTYTVNKSSRSTSLAHGCVCSAGSVKVVLSVVTDKSYALDDVKDHVVALATTGPLQGLVDPDSVSTESESYSDPYSVILIGYVSHIPLKMSLKHWMSKDE